MMGDPFEELTIENGAIVIRHFGGSRENGIIHIDIDSKKTIGF